MRSRTTGEFDPEFRLLLACSKLPTDEVLVRGLVSQVADWEKFLRYAEWHELTPLICHALMDAGCSLPSATSEHLVSTTRQNTQKNLLLTAELLRIIQALVGEKIRAIPYKGPVLAASTYGNLAMRGFCDLDLLIAKQDVQRARSVMLQLGYGGEYSLTPAQETRYLRSACEHNFVHHGNRVQVEIHWQVVPVALGLALEFDRFWSRTQLLQIGGARLHVLSPEDAVLVLSIHGFKHLWSCLKWVCDIATLLSSSADLDWSYILDEADRIGAARVVLVVLFLANQLYQSRLPDPVRLRFSRDPVAVSIAREIVGSYSLGASMSRLKARLLTARAYSGFRRRANYVARTLIDPATEEVLRTPERPMGVMHAQRVLHVARQAIFDFCKSRESQTTKESPKL
jgi:Uncharacterised nucleotidyltransferase